jgi:hypothetical protein
MMVSGQSTVDCSILPNKKPVQTRKKFETGFVS